MIIFLSSAAPDISQQLRGALTKGAIGIYDSSDDRAVRQAAALVGGTVFILNIYLVRLSIAGLGISSALILNHKIEHVAQSVFWVGVIIGLVSIAVDSISVQRFLKRKL